MTRSTQPTAGVEPSWASDVARHWNAFWFTPRAPHTLGVIRILAGAMLLYTHLVGRLGWKISSAPTRGSIEKQRKV